MYAAYFKVVDEYTEKYPNTDLIVFMQNGDFYESYEYKDLRLPGDLIRLTKESITNKGSCFKLAERVNKYRDITISLKDGQRRPHGLTNPYMMGVHLTGFKKWVKIFLECGFKVVKMDQIVTDEKGPKERKVVEFISNGTYLCEENNHGTMNLFIELDEFCERKIEDSLISCSVSYLDNITSKSVIGETRSTFEQPKRPINNISKFIIDYNPKELVINLYDFSEEQKEKYKNFLNKFFGNGRGNYIIYFFNCEKEFLKKEYQVQFMKKIFPQSKNTYSSFLLVSYIHLLQYINDHNETLIKNINPPTVTNFLEGMTIQDNTVYNLNLLSNNQNTSKKKSSTNSLYSIINKCKTVLGRRLLKFNLLHPFTDINKIICFYNGIDELMCDRELLEEVGKNLSGMVDLTKLHRLIVTQKISYTQFYDLVENGYTKSIKLINVLIRFKSLKSFKMEKEKRDTFYKIYKYILNIFDIKNRKIKEGYNREYDELNKNFKKEFLKLEEENEKIGGEIRKNKVNEAFCITLTKSVSTKAKYAQYKKKAVKGKRNWLYNDDLEKIGRDCYFFETKMKEKERIIFIETLNEIINSNSYFEDLDKFVGELDYIFSGAQVAIKNKYFKPKVCESEESFFSIKELRHPIIEKIIDSEYITNDICSKEGGILLFGCNSVGKSSLTKAIGCNIILAQMGYFTSCHLKYSIYNNIFTRLSGNDNMYEAKSSFILEVDEMKVILDNVSSKSLVLGDELYRGTESVSGTSLTIASILALIKGKTSFVFCTHMHHLLSSKKISENLSENRLQIKHLQISCDHDNNLVYNRKLKDGPGDTVYGLEVAKSILGKEFIDTANEIRKEIEGIDTTILSTKTSRYNSKLYVDNCEICGDKIDLHTHHKKEQHLADEDGFIGHFHKNALFNLMTVCKSCHQAIHVQK